MILALLSIGLASAEDVSSLNTTVSTDLMNDSSTGAVASEYGEINSLNAASEDVDIGLQSDLPNENTSAANSSNFNETNSVNSKTFTELNNEINEANGTLTFDSNYKMADNESTSFKEGITISKNITIDGNGYTIDAMNLGRIFKIDGNYTVILANVTLTNGKIITVSKGGAIYKSKGNLTLINVNFVNNFANADGGAIYSDGDDGFTVVNSTFVNNFANYNGGAILNSGAGFTVVNSTFVNNNVSWNGGAIYSGYGGSGSVSGCTFVDNFAYNGGAIYNIDSGATVSNSTFVGNTARNGGDAIGNYDGTLIANDNWWGNNNPDWDKLVYGNVAHDNYAVLNLKASDDNITVNFYRSGTNTVLPISRDVKLAIADTKSTGKIVDGTFTKAYEAPEGIYTITASVDNQELTTVNYVYVDYVNGNDTNNGTGWSSAVKTISKAMELVINNGRIYLADGTHVVDSRMTVDKTVTIMGNGSNTIIKQKNNKGVFSITANNVAIYNSTFTGIYESYSGAIENSGVNLTVDGCTFADNFAEWYGGAIYNKGANLVVNDCIFTNNKVEEYGGAIFNSGANLTVSNSIFVDNTADTKGGAIYTSTNMSGIANGNWWGNSTPDWDKLVYGNVTHDTYAVLNLTANIDTIAINFYRNGTDEILPFSRDFKYTIDAGDAISEKIINGTFETNYTTPRVGYYDITANVDNEKLTVNVDNNNAYVDYVNGNDTNNGASWSTAVKTISKAMELVLPSGRIYLANGTHVVDSQINVNKAVKIIGNESKTVITAIANNRVFYITAADVAIYNCTFANNSASMGAVIDNMGANLTVSGCTFVNNSASNYYGGAIYNNAVNLVVDACTFVNNSASWYGSAIYNDVHANFTVSNSTFVNNTAGMYPYVIYSISDESSSANDNWWGNNTLNWGNLVKGKVAHDSFAVLNLTATTDTININFNRNGTNVILPISRDLNFTIDTGDVIYDKIINGTFKTSYIAPKIGTYNITASVDNEKLTVIVVNDNVYVDPVNGNDTNTGASWSTAVKTIGKAIELIPENGNVYLADGNHLVTSCIDVAKNVTVIGNGSKTIITTNGKNRVFYITADDVDIYNSTFANNSAYNGGAIYDDGDSLTVSGCTFVDNFAYNGGAIYYGGADLTVSDCTFVNGSAYNGGAIYNGIGSITVSDSNFTNSSANYGVIYNGASGILSLNNNEYSVIGEDETPIYNIGVIASPVTITVLGNQTINVHSCDTITLLATVTCDGVSVAGGTLKFVIAGGEYGVAASNANGTYTLDYTINFSGEKIISANYVNAVNATVNIAILNASKYDPLMNVTADNITFGQDLTVDVELSKDAEGNISIIVDGAIYSKAVKDGNVNLVIKNLGAGLHSVIVEYSGSDKYLDSEVVKQIDVAKAIPTLNVAIKDVNYNRAFIIEANLTGINNMPLNGRVIVNINNKNHVVVVNNGAGRLKVDDKLTVGQYIFTATWDENNNYTAATTQGKFNVTTSDAPIVVSVDDIKVGENAEVIVRLASDAAGEVKITIGNETYNAAIKDGVATKTLANYKAGTYTVNVDYTGDKNYNMASNTTNFTVYKNKCDIRLVGNECGYGSEYMYVVLPDGAAGNVTIKFGNYSYSTDVKNGLATIALPLLDVGYYKLSVNYTGDDKYLGCTCSDYLFVLKANATLNAVISDADYGKNSTATVKLIGINSIGLTGVVDIRINNTIYEIDVVNGSGIFKGIDLPVGEYKFTATWWGSLNYNVAQDNGTFNIAKINPTLDVYVTDINVGDDEIIEFILPKSATGNVTIEIAGNTYTADVEDGVKIISDLGAGNYTAVVTYNGDNNYNSATAKEDFIVSKISKYEMNITIPTGVKFGEESIIEVNLPNDATGEVIVTVDGENYSADVENATANINIPPLSVGVHNITVDYAGDERYNPITKHGSITILPNDVNLTAENIAMIYHDGTRLIATLTDTFGNPISNVTLFFSLNGMMYDRITDENGSASMALNLDSGKYSAVITYFGNASYNAAVANVNITIAQSIIGNDIVKMYQNDTPFYATFFDNQENPLANTNVTFNINGVFYTRETNENGTAKLNINLRPGNYTLTAYNPVTGEELGFNVLIKSLIVASDLTKYYNNASKFEAKVYNKDGSVAANRSVVFNINGMFYTRQSDENGTVSLAINLMSGEYIITTIYDGLEVSNNVNILPTLITEDLAMHYHDESAFNATTLDGQGNPLANQTVLFNVNGVFYNRTTGNDGVASLTINLNKGKYIITSMWDDCQVGNKITIS